MHGGYSGLPQRIAERYAAACADPGLLDLADTLALLKALVHEQADRLGREKTLDAEREFLERVERLAKRREEAWRIKLARTQVINARDLVALQVIQLNELRRRAQIHRIPAPVIDDLILGMVEAAGGGAKAPPEYREALRAEALPPARSA